MIRSRFHFLTILFVFLLLGTACQKKEANLEAEKAAVTNVVETYLKADFAGACLSTDNYLKSGLSSITIAEGEGPGWDNVTLIKSSSIISADVNGRNATVIVSYDVLGEVPGAVNVIIDKKVEKYSFKLKNKNGSWKLVSPNDLRPHIAVDTAIKHIEGLNMSEKDSQPNEPKVIQQLKQLKTSL